jgi:glutathione S-transferase
MSFWTVLVRHGNDSLRADPGGIMKVHGVLQSPFVRKVCIALHEKGLRYEMAPVVPGMHPQGKMPVLSDGDVAVPDSSVICAYLERKHPSPPLYPNDPADLARALYLEEYADGHMSEGMGAIVLERIVKPNLLGQPTDEKLLAQLLESARQRWFGESRSAAGQPVPSVMDYLEGQIPSDRDSVLPRFGIADIALGAHFGWLAAAGFELDSRRWPRTARYREALEKRPSFQQTQT